MRRVKQVHWSIAGGSWHCFDCLEDHFEEFDLFTVPFLGTCKEIVSSIDKTSFKKIHRYKIHNLDENLISKLVLGHSCISYYRRLFTVTFNMLIGNLIFNIYTTLTVYLLHGCILIHPRKHETTLCIESDMKRICQNVNLCL